MSTMRQVASRAGVSAKTVSRVMRNDRYVSQDVRRRVEQAITELGYVPNALARSFRSGSDTAIGVAVPEISDPFFAAVTHAVEEVARSRGVAVFVTSLSNEPAAERVGLEALLGRQLAGLIATPVAHDQSYLQRWQQRMAMVFIDRPPAKITADTVVEDDRGGALRATAHLVAHGHERIAFIGDTRSIATTARRLEGYRTALSEAGVPEDPHLIAFNDVLGMDTGALVGALLARPSPPTAIFSSNARSSQAVVPSLMLLGRRDVAVVSFGDFPLASALDPPLTVVDQNPYAVGEVAADRLFERLDHPDRRLKRKIVLPVSLVPRGSCCPDGALHGAGTSRVCDLAVRTGGVAAAL